MSLLGCAGALSVLVAGCAPAPVAKLLAQGDERELRERDDAEPQRSNRRPDILVIALDGIERDLLYEMLRRGELPHLSRLLFGSRGEFPHAHFEDDMLSTLPSSTVPAWITALTGAPPAVHGVTGNELFIREQLRFAAPIPVSFNDSAPVLACFTDNYANELSRVPSVFERMRQRDPKIQIWITMHFFHRGADKLLLIDRTVITDAAKAFLERTVTAAVTSEASKEVYETLDEEVMEAALEELADEETALPNVLFAYLGGIDLFAHVANEGPDRARRDYLKDALEPEFEKLYAALVKRRALRDQFVVLTSDHGHTEVIDDEEHALDDEPRTLLTKAGFRVRPFEHEVEGKDFQAVLAYQGAMAYVYLADRSVCAKRGQACDWKKPPRFEDDVLAAADAFYQADRTGAVVPRMKDTLHMVLARKPKPYAERDDAFQVYVGNGKLVPLSDHLAKHPLPSYVAFAERLEDLGVGPAGERAGDVLLLPHNGDRERPAERYYFALRYRSFHGSASRRDSEIPLIVAHPKKTTAELAGLVERYIGKAPRQQDFADLLLKLRFGNAPNAGP